MKLLGIGSRIVHPEFGKGVVTNLTSEQYWVTFIDGGLETIPIDDQFDVIEAVSDEVDTVSFSDVELSLISILRRWSDTNNATALASKWNGGSLVLKPGEANLSENEIPINTFFHKVVMVRDRIRVMEQKINASKNLNDQEKVELQQYITRIYGSLTTFNVLFQNKSDQFRGEKSN